MTNTFDIADTIRRVKSEIADGVRRGAKLEFVVPHGSNGNLDYSATLDTDLNRIGIAASVPPARRGQVFENVLGIGPQDGEQNFNVSPRNVERGTAFTICGL